MNEGKGGKKRGGEKSVWREKNNKLNIIQRVKTRCILFSRGGEKKYKKYRTGNDRSRKRITKKKKKREEYRKSKRRKKTQKGEREREREKERKRERKKKRTREKPVKQGI